jgi:transposase
MIPAMRRRTLAEIAGVERKIHFFAVDLPHSDACFVQAYPAETTEAFCDGHNAAFRAGHLYHMPMID